MSQNELHYGLVVGINLYPGIRNLQRAKGDAEKFAEWLESADGGNLPPANIIKVVADEARMSGETPREDAVPIRRDVFIGLDKLRKAVDARIRDNPGGWKQTRLYFYVSGHGIAPDANDAALLLADASPEWYNENISCALLLSFLNKNQPFREVVIFADCCRERGINAEPGGVLLTLPERNNGAMTTVFGCATYFGDLAYEPPEDEAREPDQLRGYFTQALLEGLTGQAAGPDGEITSNTLAGYVKQRVQELTKHKRRPQTPQMIADPAAPIVFRNRSAQPPAIKHQVTLTFVTAYNGLVQLWDGNNQVIGEHRARDGDWTLELAKGLYQVTPKDEAAGISFRNGGFFKVIGEAIHVEI